jgi:secretion/DNA translocation related TadE-like protein
MVGAILSVTAGGLYVGSAVVARHRAQASADLAALAAAAALPAGVETACQRTAQVLREMRARAVDCAVTGLDVVVTAEVAMGFPRWGAGFARASARAGPMT